MSKKKSSKVSEGAATVGSEQLAAPDTQEETKKDGPGYFLLQFVVAFRAEASSEEEAKSAAEKLAAAMFRSHQVIVSRVSEAGDGRWRVVNGELRREPVRFKTTSELRSFQTFEGDLAASDEVPGAQFVYHPSAPKTAALDPRYTIASRHEGVWLEVKYMARLLKEQQMQQTQQMQREASGASMPGRVK